MANLKAQATKGIIWSSIERFSVQGISFVLSFIIARQLMPSDYGLIAMLSIFMAIAQSFIDSGFANALIQKKNRTDIDFYTVFIFNIAVSVIIYFIFVACAPLIASFYNMPILKTIIGWVGLNLIINAFSAVQRTKFIIELNFKTQALISLIATIAGGLMGVYMAYNGYGVWTLVFSNLGTNSLTTILYWLLAKWRPQLKFSIQSFKELFGFGSKLLGGALIHIIYRNFYTLIIGKMFSASELGLFNKAFTISQYPSSNITGILTRVTYPVECKTNNDEQLYNVFNVIVRLSAFTIFPLMIGLCSISRPFIFIVLTEKWMGIVPYLQIMCIAFMWDPIMRFCWDILNVKHRSDLSLKSEIFKKIAAFILLFAALPLGVKAMCFSLLAYSLCDIMIVTQYTKRLIPTITFVGIIRIILPHLFISSMMGIIVYIFTVIVDNVALQLLGGIIVGVISYVGLSKMFCKYEFEYLLELVKSISNKKS